MPNGKHGDHPLTDIVIHRARVYSDTADAMIRRIVELGGRDEISDMLLFEFNTYAHPDVTKLEAVLRPIVERLEKEARERGWET